MAYAIGLNESQDSREKGLTDQAIAKVLDDAALEKY